MFAEFLLYLPCGASCRLNSPVFLVGKFLSKVLRRANASVDADETTDHVAPFAAIGLLAQMLPMPTAVEAWNLGL